MKTAEAAKDAGENYEKLAARIWAYATQEQRRKPNWEVKNSEAETSASLASSAVLVEKKAGPRL